MLSGSKAINEALLAIKNKDAYHILKSRYKKISSGEFSFYIHDYTDFYCHFSRDKNRPKKKEPLLPPYEPHVLLDKTNSHYVILNKYMLLPGHILLSGRS